ncbi:acyltransferase family protein [Aestuariicoccus sp. MJ-SS9]|uniref:acyltransferase family protein n=1 Tax=Aestuariicoccus sp. MJ-SS9 TaxID=3079855 RepID=UPI00290A3AB7|nr:acyltransferase family protein [Aestuariicoccus sp. MJ-SS9]MDU8910823.1 acyltransferase family protein [Aestuariicoccus sp. MJ-SS9]
MKETGQTALPYRSDIDGLRAIAVLAVVFYHFNLPYVTGGFIGVDIFFVISGFLIGSILWREYDRSGTIWLRHFYMRRFRRLAPAFFVMALLTTGVAWAILLPFEFREYGKALIASTIYLSNVLFYRQAGYFDTVSEDKPLLHTWSLAVEEQFYIFLPLAILLLARWRAGLVGFLVAIWALSLVACVALTPTYSTATFYLFPFRAWELLSGVLLAIWGIHSRRQWRGYSVLSVLGLALLIFGLVTIEAGPAFPGAQAMLPVFGTVLLLANGTGRNMVNRLLSHRWPVFIGKISYSLYLWHWPVYTLSTYLRGGDMPLAESVLWMGLSFVLAWLSWRFVEQPVREARGLSGVCVLGGTVAASGILLLIGSTLYTRNGLPDRFGPEVRPHIQASADFLQDWSRCEVPQSGALAGLEVCPIGPEGPPRVLVWGDSHVRAFREGLDLAAHEAGTPGIILWRSGCPPLFGIRKVESAATQAQDLACTRANKQIRQSFGRMESLEKILLVGRWTYYSGGTGVGLDAENRIAVYPVDGPVDEAQPQSERIAEAAAATVAGLMDFFDEIAVLRQPPEIAEYDSRRAAREAAHRAIPLAAVPVTRDSIPRSALAARVTEAEAPWREMAASGAVIWIDTWPRLCDQTECDALHDGTGFYFDNNHLTNSAAIALRDLFAPVFGGEKRQTALR